MVCTKRDSWSGSQESQSLSWLSYNTFVTLLTLGWSLALFWDLFFPTCRVKIFLSPITSSFTESVWGLDSADTYENGLMSSYVTFILTCEWIYKFIFISKLILLGLCLHLRNTKSVLQSHHVAISWPFTPPSEFWQTPHLSVLQGPSA